MSSSSLDIELQPISSDYSAEFYEFIDGNRGYFAEYLDWINDIKNPKKAHGYLAQLEDIEDDGKAIIVSLLIPGY